MATWSPGVSHLLVYFDLFRLFGWSKLRRYTG